MESLFTGIKLMELNTQPVVDAHPSNMSSNPAIFPVTPFESDFGSFVCQRSSEVHGRQQQPHRRVTHQHAIKQT